jgi:hypothetical protein
LEEKMALSAIGVTCGDCRNRFRATPTRSFLGFQKLKCAKCSKDILYPLTSGYRTIYRVVLALTLIAIVVNLSQGRKSYPGLLGFAAVFALFEDSRLRKAILKPTITQPPTAPV